VRKKVPNSHRGWVMPVPSQALDWPQWDGESFPDVVVAIAGHLTVDRDNQDFEAGTRNALVCSPATCSPRRQSPKPVPAGGFFRRAD
jgi:hypothetical protein